MTIVYSLPPSHFSSFIKLNFSLRIWISFYTYFIILGNLAFQFLSFSLKWTCPFHLLQNLSYIYLFLGPQCLIILVFSTPWHSICWSHCLLKILELMSAITSLHFQVRFVIKSSPLQISQCSCPLSFCCMNFVNFQSWFNFSCPFHICTWRSTT